jgi:hypothetical protein
MASGFRRRRRVTAKERLTKIMERAEVKLNKGHHYEASQTFKTLVPRYVKTKKFSDAADLLREGSLKMLKHKQFRDALDLSTDLLGLSKDANDDQNVNEMIRESLVKILESFPESSEKQRILQDALQWSKSANTEVMYENGHPSFHAICAKSCVSRGDVRTSFNHFLYSRSPVDFAKLICAQISKGYSSEYDMFVLRAVLSLLCAGAGVNEADLLLCEIETRSKRRSKEFPLLRFCNRLLGLIRKGEEAVELFHLLIQVYSPGFSKRDPNITKLLSKIGVNYFGEIPPSSSQQRQQGGPFGGHNAGMMKMMRMMMGGGRK